MNTIAPNTITISVSVLKKLHDAYKPKCLQKLKTFSEEKLIELIYLEIIARNNAYISIMETGLYSDFIDYSGLNNIKDSLLSDINFKSLNKEQLIYYVQEIKEAKNQAYYFQIKNGILKPYIN